MVILLDCRYWRAREGIVGSFQAILPDGSREMDSEGERGASPPPAACRQVHIGQGGCIPADDGEPGFRAVFQAGAFASMARARSNAHTHTSSFKYLTFSRNERNVEFYFPFSLLLFSLSSSCIRLFLYPFQLMTLQFEIKFGLTVDSLNLFLTSFLCIF